MGWVCDMNPYLLLGSGLGTSEASSLSARLSAWHDAMVAHERRLRTGRTSAACDDECPHAEARALWSEALAIFGSRAHELTFLRLRANGSGRRSTAGDVAPQLISEDADTREQRGGTRSEKAAGVGNRGRVPDRVGGDGCLYHRGVADRGSASGRSGDTANGSRGVPAGPVLRLAEQAAAPGSG